MFEYDETKAEGNWYDKETLANFNEEWKKEVKRLEEEFDDLDSEIAEREEKQSEVLTRLEELGIAKCDFCFEWFNKNDLRETQRGLACKKCSDIVTKPFREARKMFVNTAFDLEFNTHSEETEQEEKD